MGKIILSILLATSASSSLLLAQSGNRLKATNQVAGTKQGTGNRVQDKNRLKVIGCRLENRLEAIGYRLEEEKNQGADNRNAELTLENQMGQRIEPTTNYELRTASCDNSAGSLNCYPIAQGAKITTNYEPSTTNCNNQGDDLDCYLMMDPAFEEGAEAKIATLGKALGISEGKNIGEVRKISILEESEPATIKTSIIETATLKTVSNILTVGKYSVSPSGKCARESTHHQSDVSNLNQCINQPRRVEKRINSSRDRMPQFNKSTFLKAACIAWASFANVARASSVADPAFNQSLVVDAYDGYNGLLCKLACVDEVGIFPTKTTETNAIFVARKEGEAQQLYNAAEASKKEQEAREKAQITFGLTSDLWKEVVSALWEEVAGSMKKSAEYWKKASEAQTDQAILGYSIAAEQSEKTAEQSRKAIEAYAKVIGEDRPWTLEWEYAQKEEKKRQSQEGDRWREAGKSVQLSIDYRIKEMEVRSIGQEVNAQEYAKVAEVFQQASEKFIQAAQLLQEGKWKETNLLWSQGVFLQSEGMTKKYKLQELEAQEAEKVILVADYKNVCATSERSENKFRQSVKKNIEGKESEANRWYWEGKSLQSKADYQAKESEALATGKVMLAAGYREASVTLEKAADQFKLSTETQIVGKWIESNIRHEFGNVLQTKADYQAKACEAKEEGKTTLSSGYEEAIATLDAAVNEYELATIAYAVKTSEKNGEGISKKLEGKYLHMKAKYQVKAYEAQEMGKTILAEGYREVAATYQRAADQLELAVLAYSSGKESEGESLDKGGFSLQLKAKYQAKAYEAQEVGKTILAEGYRITTEILEDAGNQWKLAAEIKNAGKIREGISWDWVGKSLQAQADYQVKAYEAQETGQSTFAASYRKAAETSQRAVDQWKLSAETKASGNKNEDVSWDCEGESLQAKAYYQAKASEAQKAGKTALADSYREAAVASQRAANQFKQSDQAFSWWNLIGYIRLYNAGQSTQKEADAIVKRAEETIRPTGQIETVLEGTIFENDF